MADRDDIDKTVKSLSERGETDAALEATVRGYGPEIYGFLVATHRDETAASDVFSTFCEDVWRGLPKFRWECTLRTWVYMLARHASHRHRRSEAKHKRDVPADTSRVREIAEAVRSETASWLRTDRKNEFTKLRSELAPEDQELLVLRVDRDLSWEELAHVTLGEEAAASAERVKRESARLRKRFQAIRERLHELGLKAGLIGDRTK